jgi:hypothetical protein
MPRPLVWLSGVVLLAVALAALVYRGAAREPAAQRSTPRIVVLDPPRTAPSRVHDAGSTRHDGPEVVVVGDLAPARRSASSLPSERVAKAPRVIHEIVYVTAPADEGLAASVVYEPGPASSSAMTRETPSEPGAIADGPDPIVANPAPRPTVPAPVGRTSNPAGDIAAGAAIGAGIGAVLGGGRGALRGALGGAAGGAIGGRSGAVLGGVLGGVGSGSRGRRGGGCWVTPSRDLVSTIQTNGGWTP